MRAENASHALALVVVDELARCGITDAVLAPGSRSAALAMAFHDDPRIRLHVEHDERSAGFLAIGLGRATGRPAPVVTTSGSAVANLHPAVVESDTGGVPLLALTADRPPELRHAGANQTIDQAGLFAGATRWWVDVGVPEDRPDAVAYWRSTVCRAVAEATGHAGAPGPVQINLPFREPLVPVPDDGRAPPAQPFAQPLDGRPGGQAWTAVTPSCRRLSTPAVEALAAQLAAAERGLVVVGQTAASPVPILRLAQRLRWPVVAEPMANARIGPPVVAAAHHLLAAAPFARAHLPDLVLRIGRTGLSRHLDALLDPSVDQILVEPDGAWHDPQRAAGQLVVADVAATCDAVTEVLTAAPDSDWAAAWARADTRAREVIDALLDADERPSEPRIARDVAATVPNGTTLVVASSMPVRDLDQFMRPRDGLRVVANRGASGIDGFVSTTLGVSLGSPGGPTVALTGDLSLLHDAAGFHVAPDATALDATFVVVDNDGGGIFSFLPQARFPGSFERVFGTPHGRDLADLARFHRLGYRRVEVAGQLPSTLLESIGDGGVQLVHVRTDRSANVDLHRRIAAAVADALDPASGGA